MDGGAWWATVHGVAKSQTWLSDFTFTFCMFGLPCGSASKNSVSNAGDLGSIPGLGRSPGEGKDYPLQYSGLYSPWGHRVGHDWATFTSLHFCMFNQPSFISLALFFVYEAHFSPLPLRQNKLSMTKDLWHHFHCDSWQHKDAQHFHKHVLRQDKSKKCPRRICLHYPSLRNTESIKEVHF